MTTLDAPSTRTGRSLLPIAIAAGMVALLLMLIGTYVHTPYKATGPGEWGLSSQDLNLAPLLVAFAVLGAAVVFGVVVARGLRTAPQQTARRSLIVAGVGVVSIVAFWTGLPRDPRRRRRHPRRGRPPPGPPARHRDRRPGPSRAHHGDRRLAGFHRLTTTDRLRPQAHPNHPAHGRQPACLTEGKVSCANDSWSSS